MESKHRFERLTGVVPFVANSVIAAVEYGEYIGQDYRVQEGIRDPIEAAKNWRKGRSSTVIGAKIAWLRARGEGKIADLLVAAGPQYEKKVVTNALPYDTPHMLFAAVDVYVFLNNKPAFEPHVKWTPEIEALWKRMGAIGRQQGLVWGGDWTRFKDFPHFEHPNFQNRRTDLRKAAIQGELTTELAAEILAR